MPLLSIQTALQSLDRPSYPINIYSINSLGIDAQSSRLSILGLARIYVRTQNEAVFNQLLDKLNPYIEAQARTTHFNIPRFSKEQIVGESQSLIWELLKDGRIKLEKFNNENDLIAYLKVTINNYFISQIRKEKRFRPEENLGEEETYIRSSVTRFGNFDERTETRKRALEILVTPSDQGLSLLEEILSKPVSKKDPTYTEFKLFTELNLYEEADRISNGNNNPSSTNENRGLTRREISQKLGVHEGTISRSIDLIFKRLRIALGIIEDREELNKADIRFIRSFTKSDIIK